MRVISRCFLNGSLSQERRTSVIVSAPGKESVYYPSMTKSEYKDLIKPGDIVSTFTQHKWQTSILKDYNIQK